MTLQKAAHKNDQLPTFPQFDFDFLGIKILQQAEIIKVAVFPSWNNSGSMIKDWPFHVMPYPTAGHVKISDMVYLTWYLY